MPAQIPAEFEKAFLKLSIRHPHIGKNITQVWGTGKLLEYLDSLLYDKRPGRMGFQRYILVILMQLHVAHEKLFPQYQRPRKQPEPAISHDRAHGFGWDEIKG